ncbi:MAG: phospholipid carrier-dependent glycosyltransferase [Deltaproteobacteria bacterium]|nr:phospholipid carrier-dependent glycosyltransferase [Deltaproteobacteria bacterium]
MSNLPQSSVADIALGVASGSILAALICYGLFLAVIPAAKGHTAEFKKAAVSLILLLVAKTTAILFFPGFHVDVGTYEAWALQLAAGGPASMYQSGYFLDYPPGYLYPLWAAGAIAHALGARGAELRMIIGIPALIADLALSILIFALTLRLFGRALAWLGMLLFALNPALLFDTVVWVQTDSAFTLMMLLSVVMMMEEEVVIGWALAGLALVIKPQAISLLPVLLVWTVMRSHWQRWARAALAFAAVMIAAAAPFQVGHPWNWLPNLYLSTFAFYHETSVNAFNFMALLGGLRAPDSDTIFGCSYFAIGISLLIALYGFALWLLSRNAAWRNLLFASFVTIFGFFVFAPRMHERYVYPAVVFAIPLALEHAAMLGVFSMLTLTCLSNLADILHILNAGTFLDLRDPFAMTISLVNVIIFCTAAVYWYACRGSLERFVVIAPFEKWFSEISRRWRKTLIHSSGGKRENSPRLDWLRADTIALLVLVTVAAFLRLWHLGHPAEIVFDEVHFVGQARHYIHGEPFMDPHPPIAKLLIAAGILLFGDHASSWRIANALLGTAMVAITYLLGRRMFGSRLAATLSAGLITLDGFFIVDSRIGCIDIVYLTLAAIAYLLLFRFVATRNLIRRRRLLLAIGVVLGLCLGSKLYVPAVTFLLVSSFLLLSLWRTAKTAGVAGRRSTNTAEPTPFEQTAGAALIVGSVSAMFYLGAFLPHYALGWWGGIADLLNYYKDVIWYENSVATATHPYASPWWSWPLMLRPIAYWQNFPPHGKVALIWGGGNPLTWWAVVPAIMITGARAVEWPNLSRIFLLSGFFAYYVIWIPIGRILFLYHYLPSVYIGYLALGAILADMWSGDAEAWEIVVLLLSILAVLILGAGHIAGEYRLVTDRAQIAVGLLLAGALLLCYVFLVFRQTRADRFVVIAFLTLAIALFIYYLPIWLGTPISRNGYYARMWLQGPGLPDWI